MGDPNKAAARQRRRQERAERRAASRERRAQRTVQIRAAMDDHRTFMDEYSLVGKLKKMSHPLAKVLREKGEVGTLSERLSVYFDGVMQRASADEDNRSR